MNISDEAVEAALQATFAGKTISDFNRRVWTGTVKTILEAAAPHIRSQILEQAAAEIDEGVAAHGQEQYADWLRSRATDELTPRG